MRVKYNQKYVDYLTESTKNQVFIDDFLDLNNEFIYKNKEIYLEIGPGKGKFIIDLASKNLDKNFIVCELNKTISGQCLKKIDESNLKNIRLICMDFYKVAENIKEPLFDGIILNFSDPWHKKRHEKRRLTSDNFLKVYYKVLKMNKNIILKTDNDGFFEYSHEQLKKFNYEITYYNEDYKEDDEFDAFTEYEQKFIEKNVKIKRLIAKKNGGTLHEIK